MYLYIVCDGTIKKFLQMPPVSTCPSPQNSGGFYIMEEWKWIPGYENHYMASTLGRIKSCKKEISIYRKDINREYKSSWKEKILKQAYRSDYKKVGLSMRNEIRQPLVHRVIALTFIPNPENKRTINHKNGIKTDNRAENLEWFTDSENHQHAHLLGLMNPNKGEDHYNSKLNEFQIRVIRKCNDLNKTELGKIFNVIPQNIGCIKSRKTWKHVK